MAELKRHNRTIVPAEEFVADVAALMDFARQRGREGRGIQTDTKKQRHFTELPNKPDIRQSLESELREALEVSVVPAVEVEDTGLFEIEKEREIQKKALLVLSRKSLARLAETMNLDKRGTSEELAERVAGALKHDEQKIAELIIENADEPEPARRFASRIFPVEEHLDVERLSERIGWAVGRYIRIGVARWIVFEDSTLDGDDLSLSAQLFSYGAHVDTEADYPALSTTQHSSSIKLVLMAGHPAVHIDQVATNESRGAMKALESVSDIHRLGRLPAPSGGLEGALGSFDPTTILMLDLLYNRVQQAGAASINLTAAKFRMDKDEQKATADEEESDRPTLRSVRFEGRHLLDSPTACRLIAKEGRALVDVSMTVAVEIADGAEELRYPVRFSFDSDHIAVMTGFGLIPKFARPLHERLIEGAEAALEDGISSQERLEDLAERILALSSSDSPRDRPETLRTSQ